MGGRHCGSCVTAQRSVCCLCTHSVILLCGCLCHHNNHHFIRYNIFYLSSLYLYFIQMYVWRYCKSIYIYMCFSIHTLNHTRVLCMIQIPVDIVGSLRLCDCVCDCRTGPFHVQDCMLHGVQWQAAFSITMATVTGLCASAGTSRTEESPTCSNWRSWSLNQVSLK